MLRIFTLRKLPLVVAGLFVASTAYSSPVPADPVENTDASGNGVGSNDSNSGTEQVTTVEVLGTHLRNERVELSPKIGTTVYTINTDMIDALGQGSDTPFNEVLLRLPGVDQDSKASGSLHVRDDHGNVQYRVDGVILPESITGFGQSIDTRFIDKIDFVTGALPAQYGLRTAGIVDIQTKEGDVEPGGQIGILMGTHNYYEPSVELFGSQGNFKYYLSGSYLTNSIGIENPLPSKNPIHDDTEQTKTFGSLAYFIDNSTRLGLLFGTYSGNFQIPNNPGQSPLYSLAGYSDASSGFSAIPSSQINENQSEVNRFFVLSFQKSLGDLNYQASYFHQYSDLHYTPDPIADLIYLGTASNSLRSNNSNGVQFDASYKLTTNHTVRAGLAYIRQTTASDNTVSVFPTENGVQSSTTPFSIVDNSGKTGNLSSFYVQDEWRLSAPLTLNYGLRFDHVDAYIQEQQVSPRINLAYKYSDATAFHAGYSRYFTPPPQELEAQGSINLYANTTNAPEVANSDSVKAERTHYFDVGVTHKVDQNLTLTADAYYKKIANLIDEGQFGQALILTPFNYERGYAKGLELSSVYSEKHWGAYLNFAYQKAQGENIISSQSLFGQEELAYIANHYIYLDHDQTYSVSGGAHYHFGESQISGDLIYGSGMRNTPAGGTPNSAELPSYVTVNAALTHTFKNTPLGTLDTRLAIVNIFDKSYLLRDGTGVGVGAPQYGANRTFYVGISTEF